MTKPSTSLVAAFSAKFMFLAALSFFPHDSFADSCKAFQESYEKAEKTGNLEKLTALFQKAKAGDSGCADSQYVYCLGRRTALAKLEEAYGAYEDGKPPAQVLGIVENAETYGAPWQVLHAKAELSHEMRTSSGYSSSASLYQQALNDIAQLEHSKICEREMALLPNKAQIEKMHRQAVIAVALADEFVTPPTDRAGEYGGIFLDTVRGFTPAERPVPVTFQYRKSDFTKKGQDAVTFLLKYLKRKNLSSITLTGHTDERGSDRTNMALSKKRLETVAQFLKQGGYAGKITLVPKGETEPFAADDRSNYEKEQLYQLDRRVELRLN